MDTTNTEPNSKIPLNMDFEFIPDTPYTIDPQDHEGYGVTTHENPPQSNSSFFKSAAAEFYDFNSIAQLTHAGFNKLNEPDPLNDIPPTGWKPTSNPEIFYDIHPEYVPALMKARGPKEQQNLRNQILEEQAHDEALANGSTFSKIIGGFAGAISDPVSWIPIAGWAKYAKFAPTVFEAAAKTFPGIVKASVIQSAAKQVDRVNGNLHDFVVDAGINTVIGTALFSAFGAGGLALEKMELWNLKDMLKGHVKGIDFFHETNEKGVITGIKAIDSTGNLSAAEVEKYQQIANSSFDKSGIFKIPYIGQGLLTLKGAPVIGSPLVNMMNSEYPEVRAFINYAADHQFYTKGIVEGEERPKSFEYFMKREFAELKSISTEFNALHIEAMGFSPKPRIIGDAIRAGTALANKTIKTLNQDVEKYGYLSREDFDDKVQRVIWSGETSEIDAVNKAAEIFTKKKDDTFAEMQAAYNYPPGILSPRTAPNHMMRVYNTEYMNANLNGKSGWIPVISNYFAEADEMITARMKPINDLETSIQEAKAAHEELIRGVNKTDPEVKNSLRELNALKTRKKVLEEKLQNELRTNEDMQLHVENPRALSADEAKELNELTKKRDIAYKEIEEQKKFIADMKQKISKRKASAMKSKTVKTGKKNLRQSDTGELLLAPEEEKLHLLEKEHDEEIEKIQERIERGEINPNLYYKEEGSSRYSLRNPDERLRFRDVYESQFHREVHAKAAYDSIMHMNPEDIIADVMGKVTGNTKENPLMKRTLLVPDKLLYDNNFMTKDLMAKLNNYVLYLSRRTHLKNVFKELDPERGIEKIIEKIGKRYESKRDALESKKQSFESLKNYKLEKSEYEGAHYITLKNEIGRINLRKYEDGSYRMTGVNIAKKENRGKGYGKKLYMAAIDYTLKQGSKFYSDIDISNDAMKIYKSLIKKGYEFKKNPTTEYENYKNVETNLKPHYKSSDGKPIFELINAPKNTNINLDIDKMIAKEEAKFKLAKKQVQLSYERMMGLKKRENWEIVTQGVIRSLVAMVNLHSLPATQIADTGAIGLQAGVMPFIRDGVAPILTSLGGLLKSADSESIREVLPSIHLGLNDVINGIADKNVSMEAQPYLNLGPIVNGVNKLAHFSGNLDLTNHIENMNQRIAGSTYQGEFMRLLLKHQKGTLTPKDNEFLLKYGINADKWSERMVNSYKEAKGFKTALGGHQSMFWKWQDLEAANEFSAAVFRAVENTVIRRGMFDSPFWADNIAGMIFHTFTGWGYASVNRYVIPMLQRPDAEKLLGVLVSLSFGSLVSPIRRMARGEDAYPKDQTAGQKFYETVNDSAISSALANILSFANFITNDKILGKLKNDKFNQRVKVGSGSVVEGTINRMGNIVTALASNEWNKKDAQDLLKMLPITGALYGQYASKLYVDHTSLPNTRWAAHAAKGG